VLQQALSIGMEAVTLLAQLLSHKVSQLLAFNFAIIPAMQLTISTGMEHARVNATNPYLVAFILKKTSAITPAQAPNTSTGTVPVQACA